MCTVIFDNRYGHFFARTLDLEMSYGEEVVRTEKSQELSFLYEGKMDSRFAFLGMALKAKNESGNEVALYFDGMNESGLCVAALNFPHYAAYREKGNGSKNLASFEVIPYILANCGSVDCVEKLLMGANITSDAFSSELAPMPLHYIVADRERAIVIEPLCDGLKIYDDPVGVLTNSPPLPYHLSRLSEHASLSPYSPQNSLYPDIELQMYARGLGGYSLPGDWSSSSRFVRAVFVKAHTMIAEKAEDKNARLERMTDMMSSVSHPYGCVMTDDGRAVYTVYTAFCDMDGLSYCYFTHDDRKMRSVDL